MWVLEIQKRRLYDVGDVRVVSTEFLPEQDAFLVDNVRDGYPDRPMFDDRLQVRYNEEYAALKSKQLREAAVSCLRSGIVLSCQCIKSGVLLLKVVVTSQNVSCYPCCSLLLLSALDNRL